MQILLLLSISGAHIGQFQIAVLVPCKSLESQELQRDIEVLGRIICKHKHCRNVSLNLLQELVGKVYLQALIRNPAENGINW